MMKTVENIDENEIVFVENMYADDDVEYYLILNKKQSAFTIQELNQLFNDCKDAIPFGKKLAKMTKIR